MGRYINIIFVNLTYMFQYRLINGIVYSISEDDAMLSTFK